MNFIKKNRLVIKMFICIVLLLSSILSFLGFVVSLDEYESGKAHDLFYSYSFLMFSLCFSVAGLLILKSIKELPKHEYREYLLNELNPSDSEQKVKDKCKGRNESNESVQADKKDIIGLMLKNNDETTEYFTISKRQARSSYLLSVVTCMVGVIMLGIAVCGAIILKSIPLTIIGTASGAITEVISGTVLWIHNKSALQLNYYYDALHENERLLSAITLADQLSDDKREEMYIEIIKKQIESKAKQE